MFRDLVQGICLVESKILFLGVEHQGELIAAVDDTHHPCMLCVAGHGGTLLKPVELGISIAEFLPEYCKGLSEAAFTQYGKGRYCGKECHCGDNLSDLHVVQSLFLMLF